MFCFGFFQQDKNFNYVEKDESIFFEEENIDSSFLLQDIKTDLLFINRKTEQSLDSIKYIVIHYTANNKKGADALAHKNYFDKTKRKASVHYVVDDVRCVQLLPDSLVSWCCGDHYYNHNSISIEMCFGGGRDSLKIIRNTQDKVDELLKKYGLFLDAVKRHYDVTGKLCPLPLVDETKWSIFLGEISSFR